MTFNNKEEAWDYWQDCWYESGKGYEGLGCTLSDQLNIFNDWLEDHKITFPNMNLQD